MQIAKMVVGSCSYQGRLSLYYLYTLLLAYLRRLKNRGERFLDSEAALFSKNRRNFHRKNFLRHCSSAPRSRGVEAPGSYEFGI
jgi:hypothetical protein